MSILKIIIIKVLFLLSIFYLNAQCDKGLIEKAITQSGDSALFLKSFKAKLRKGKLKRPERVAKYLIRLKSNTTYRFNVLNDKKYEGKVILQLFKKDKFQNSTYDFENQVDKQSFDFYCYESGNYEIIMSFLEGKPGCAVGIMSMMINDSSKIDEKYIKQILYLGIKNPLYISYDEEQGANIHVSTSQGYITGKNNNYLIELQDTGFVIVNVKVTDSLGNITEKISQAFKVKKIPVPIIGIKGIYGGYILKDQLLNSKGPELDISQLMSNKYEILSFYISKDLSNIREIPSVYDKFSEKQISFLRELKQGSVFYLTKIKVIFPDGNIHELNSQKFIIRKDDF